MNRLGIRCQDCIVKFRPGSGQNTLGLNSRDVGATDYLLVFRSEDELTVHYIRRQAEKPNAAGTVTYRNIVQKVVAWNFEIVFEYECRDVKDW